MRPTLHPSLELSTSDTDVVGSRAAWSTFGMPMDRLSAVGLALATAVRVFRPQV
jgi:hypothetical protein